uniref:C-type lectin domain-containing protein n=1 Tax=Periophthalmus magnuspinnatus TaxID=409849 RepID=A0A3B4BBL6_9GOBI
MSWWSWSGSNLNDGYGKWANAGYKHPYSLQCVMMNNNGWYNKPCYKLFKSWEEAQSYCRTNYIDLAMIKSKEENLQALQVIGSNEVWIGLSRTSWKWSDGTSASFTNWNSTIEDEYPEFAFCAAEMNDRSWDVLTCLSMEYPFYCQKKQREDPALLQP